MDPIISDITTQVVAVPLKRPFVTSLRTVKTAETVIVKIKDSTGKVGFGEAAPNVVVSGDSTESILSAINKTIAPKIIGKSLSNMEAINYLVDTSMVHNTSPKAGVNIALNDLICQHYQVPMYKILGGNSDQIVTDYTVSVGTTPDMINQAKDLVSKGFTTLKIKVGSESEQKDVAKIAKIRKAIGPKVKIRLDANQGWHAKQAISAINHMADLNLDIELVEQPVLAKDFIGMAEVTKNTSTLIMADESIFSTEDAIRLINLGGCDIINIKLMKTGGISNATKLNTIAEAFGIPCMVGSMIESSVAVTAAASFAAAKRNVKYVDLDASMMFSSNPVSGGLINQKNIIKLPNVSGLGLG